jgi:hypothetical protein
MISLPSVPAHISWHNDTFSCHRDIRVDAVPPVEPLNPLKVKLHKLFEVISLFRIIADNL